MNIKNKISKINKHINIKTKIILLLLLLWILSFVVIFLSYNNRNNYIIENYVEKTAVQTMNSIGKDFETVFENIIKTTDMICLDTDFLTSLRKNPKNNNNSKNNNIINSSIDNIIRFSHYADSVIVIDRYNNCYFSSKNNDITVNTDEISQTNWFKKTTENGGMPIYTSGSEGIIEYGSEKNDSFIMISRAVNDINTGDFLAIIVATIKIDTLQHILADENSVYNSYYCVVDDSDNYIIPPIDYNNKMDSCFLGNNDPNNYISHAMYNDEKVIISSKSSKISNWKIIGMFSLEAARQYLGTDTAIIPQMIFFNLLLIIMCYFIISAFIFTPLRKWQNFMRVVEMGSLVTMYVDEERTDEISSLKRVFNKMIEAIKALMDTTVKEEKVIAQGELDLLQAQINPHFLYNTLDAVSALVLLEDNENCLKMTQALGSFYRNMLHSKNRLVTVRDEIECIESYMTVINIRYGNKIQTVYDIDNRITNYKVLKMILQPIVENAVHHGIRDYTENGIIKISAHLEGDEMVFSVADNGTGIDRERIEAILNGKTRTNSSGFGLHSSIKRLSLFYGIDNPLNIISKPGEGTKVIIRTKVIKEDDVVEH